MALSRQQTTILKDENERLMALETSFTSKSEFLSIVVNTLKKKKSNIQKINNSKTHKKSQTVLAALPRDTILKIRLRCTNPSC